MEDWYKMIHSLGGLIVHERMTRMDFRVDTRVNRACDFQEKRQLLANGKAHWSRVLSFCVIFMD